MKEYSEIKKLIKAIAGGRLADGTPSPVFLVKVKSVEGDACTVELDGMELSGVRLRSVINGNKSKVVITPAAGSYVLVTDISGNLTQLVALQYAEVDRIDITYSGKLVINEGTDTAVRASAIESKLNALRGTVNDLISKFNSHTHPATTTATIGASTTVFGAVAVTAPTGGNISWDASGNPVFNGKVISVADNGDKIVIDPKGNNLLFIGAGNKIYATLDFSPNESWRSAKLQINSFDDNGILLGETYISGGVFTMNKFDSNGNPVNVVYFRNNIGTGNIQNFF